MPLPTTGFNVFFLTVLFLHNSYERLNIRQIFWFLQPRLNKNLLELSKGHSCLRYFSSCDDFEFMIIITVFQLRLTYLFTTLVYVTIIITFVKIYFCLLAQYY